MKFATTLLAFCLSISVYSQIAVRAGESGSSEKIDLELFHLNHVLYSRGFIISDIYPSITPVDMSVITENVQANLSKGKRTNLMITTTQKVGYRLTVFVFENKDSKENGLVIMTNFSAKNGKFQKKDKDDNYAVWCPLEDNVVTGSIFALPLEDEEKALEEDDYISLININVLNTISDSTEMMKWFALAEENQPDKINNRNFLKSYYYLSKYNFTESENWLAELKKSVATFSTEEQNHWAPIMKILATEIKTLKKIKEG